MPLRVIGGVAGGRNLRRPPSDAVRPTSDRVREAIYEIIASHDMDPATVLDLYSGTGAMGIEALSRGAEHCDFVEIDSKTCDVIRDNLTRTGMLDRSKVYPLSVAKVLSRLKGPYDLVVADPPYEYDRAQLELTDVIERGFVAEGGAIVVEHSKRHEWPETLGGRKRFLTRRYGDSAVTIYR